MQLRSAALVDLRIPLEAFWTLTPREFDAFYRRHAQARERDELLVGILASVITNSGFYRPKNPAQPSDFGLGPRARARTCRTVTTLSDEEIAQKWRTFFRAMGPTAKG
jgi:hypothetical protein